MTESQRNLYFAFLYDKASWWERVFDPSTPCALRQHLDELSVQPAEAITLRYLKSLENEVEIFYRDAIGDEAIAAIEEQLFKKHGLRRIGTDPRVLVDRVAKRNRIGSKAEFGAVADYLGEDRSWEDPRRGQLEKLLGQAKVPKEWRP